MRTCYLSVHSKHLYSIPKVWEVWPSRSTYGKHYHIVQFEHEIL